MVDTAFPFIWSYYMQPIGYALDALARVQGVACRMAGWKLSNQLKSVCIEIEFAFSVQTFE